MRVHLGNAERKIVCYYTNWSIYRPGTAKFSPQNINPYLCTHLIYAFGGFTKDNALKPFDKYQDIEKGSMTEMTKENKTELLSSIASTSGVAKSTLLYRVNFDASLNHFNNKNVFINSKHVRRTS